MFEQPILKEENLIVIKEIEIKPLVTQRELSAKLSISLGKVNYLLKELTKKGLIEVKNFTDSPGKLNKLQYYLTKKGLEYKINVTRHFLKEKEAQYNYLKADLEKSLSSINIAIDSGKSIDKKA